MRESSVPPAPLRRPFPAELLGALKAAFGERVSTAEAVRAHHGRDESPFDPQLPDAVVFARNTEDVQTIVKLCGQYDVPIILTATVRRSKGTCWRSRAAYPSTCRK